MTTYTFIITDATHPVNVTFCEMNDSDAAATAKKIQRIWKAPKSACRLIRKPESVHREYVSPTSNISSRSWKLSDPQGPHTNIPICLNGIWFTPNGGRIGNIAAYRARCIESAARVPVPKI
jgi:hypothetical protein